jgi:hypothetical protein
LHALPIQVIEQMFLKVESCHQSLRHIPSVRRFIESIGCSVTVLYEEPCQSLIPLNVRSIPWFDFWMPKTFALPKSITNLSDCMGKVSWMRGMLVNAIWMSVCHHQGFERCSHSWKPVIHYWWASWPFPRWFAISPLRDCHCSTLMQEKFVPHECKEFSQMNTSSKSARKTERVTDWFAKSWEMLELCWELQRNINTYCI